MNFPKEMLPFRSQIAQLSSYLSTLKETDSLNELDMGLLEDFFSIMAAENGYPPDLAGKAAGIFADGYLKLWEKTGKKLTTDAAALAMMIGAAFRKAVKTGETS